MAVVITLQSQLQDVNGRGTPGNRTLLPNGNQPRNILEMKTVRLAAKPSSRASLDNECLVGFERGAAPMPARRVCCLHIGHQTQCRLFFACRAEVLKHVLRGPDNKLHDIFRVDLVCDMFSGAKDLRPVFPKGVARHRQHRQVLYQNLRARHMGSLGSCCCPTHHGCVRMLPVPFPSHFATTVACRFLHLVQRYIHHGSTKSASRTKDGQALGARVAGC